MGTTHMERGELRAHNGLEFDPKGAFVYKYEATAIINELCTENAALRERVGELEKLVSEYRGDGYIGEETDGSTTEEALGHAGFGGGRGDA